MKRRDWCIHVETETDVEVKRVRYLLDKESIKPATGTQFFLTADNKKVKEIMSTLMAKTSAERVHLYTIEKEDFKLDEVEDTIKVELEMNEKMAVKFTDIIIAKRRGTYQYKVPDGSKVFSVYTKKGNVEVIIRVQPLSDNRCELTVRIRGYRNAMRIIQQEFEKEIGFYLKV